MGGGEFTEGCTFDADLLAAGGGTEVVLLPTAAAFENPARLVAAASRWFAALGASVVELPVYGRDDAADPAHVATARAARFLYLVGGSPLHLRSVLKETPVWRAVRDAWDGGASVAGAGECASALCDPMVDPRGGAFTMGLGLVAGVAVLPHAGPDVAAHDRRTLELARGGLVLATVPDASALVRDEQGGWRAAGAGPVRLFVDGAERDIGALTV